MEPSAWAAFVEGGMFGLVQPVVGDLDVLEVRVVAYVSHVPPPCQAAVLCPMSGVRLLGFVVHDPLRQLLARGIFYGRRGAFAHPLYTIQVDDLNVGIFARE